METSKEDLTQGDQFYMFAYRIGILLPLIHQLKAEFSQVEQACYADDVGAGATFDEIIWLLFGTLKEHPHCASAQY